MRLKVPFLYMASAVLRMRGSGGALTWSESGKNDYFQAIAFLTLLSPESRVLFLNKIVVTFGSNAEIRFSVRSISESIVEILRLVRARFSVHVSYREIYGEHLKWLLYDRIGLVRIKNAAIDYGDMRRLLVRYFSIPSFGYWSLLLLPRRVLSRIYAAGRSVNRSLRGHAMRSRHVNSETPLGHDESRMPSAR